MASEAGAGGVVRWICAFLAAAALLILLASVVSFPGLEIAFALVAAAFPVALAALGAARNGRLGPMAWPLALLLCVLLLSVMGMLSLRGQVAEGSRVLGMPAALALQLLGLFFLPLLISSLAYGFGFEGWALREEDLSKLRQRFGSKRGSEPGGDAAGGGERIPAADDRQQGSG